MYRRRRIVVGILAVLALLGLWWLISSIVGLFTDDEPQDAASDQQTEESADDADASSAQNGSADDADSGEQDEQQDSEQDAEQQDSGGSCAPDDVTVTADTGDESYAPDEAPLLILEIENTGSESCTLDVGTAQQTFVVASGGREIFNTAQCGASAQDEEAQDEEAQDEGAQNDAQSQNDDGASLEMEFETGQTERAHLTWPRSESAADCGEPADLEPGTYELTVSLGGITSEPHEFTLTEA